MAYMAFDRSAGKSIVSTESSMHGTLAGRFRALLIMIWDAIRSGQVTRKVFPFNKQSKAQKPHLRDPGGLSSSNLSS